MTFVNPVPSLGGGPGNLESGITACPISNFRVNCTQTTTVDLRVSGASDHRRRCR